MPRRKTTADLKCAQRPRASKGVARRGQSASSSSSSCSTPEGIEGGRTSPLAPPAATAGRAQRPRASKGVAHGLLQLVLEDREVLNARGHRRGSHASGFAAPGGPELVLNARGHRRGSHWRDVRRALGRAMCSTPEGIEGGRTVACRSSAPVLARAQRPRASKGVARQGRGPANRRLAVLNARGHRRGSHPEPCLRAGPRDAVLNARGHRRGSHRVVTASPNPLFNCAQRPRASKGVAPSTGRSASSRSSSAQRPRASKGVAPSGDATKGAGILVLNARGHRRGSHSEQSG